MSRTGTNAPNDPGSAHHAGHARPLKVLAAVDGSERTGRVLELLLSMAALPITVVVLNVQPAPEDWRLRGYLSFKADEVFDRLVHDLGEPIVKGVGRRLADAKIEHSEIVTLGSSFTESVLACQREESCDLIVVSTARASRLQLLLLRVLGVSLRSTASELVQLAEVPVIVVK
jgi:nucleotide-binding universal stress UspA family protein